jgi:carboxypeptidase Q
MRSFATVFGITLSFLLATAAPAQTFATDEPVLQQIWEEATQRSELERLAQVLLDSLGPRLTGTPQKQFAHDWAVAQYERWGITARNEQYGTWRGWERGTTHVDLLSPRVRSLDAMMLAWSAGTAGTVEGRVIELPRLGDRDELEAWLPSVRGAFVLLSFPEPTCRPLSNWQLHGREETVERLRRERESAEQEWQSRRQSLGFTESEIAQRLEAAGAAGMLTSNWAGGWGVERIFGTVTDAVPTIGVSCEDYSLLARLVENGQQPRIRVDARSRFLGDVPTFNTIAELRGTELPDEYVLLSAHFDSWDGASGATDNGTGTVTMMEAMRILRQVYPNPRRTILVGHWGSEEQGLNGSRAFTEDNPHVVDGLQALFNQDNGTGRIANISMSGFTEAAEHFARWFARMPAEVTREIEIDNPGFPAAGGTDHAAFVCHGAPGFSLNSLHWDYFTYTWHTNRDTFDKLVFDDLRDNAVLVAMLAYLASEDEERVSREQRTTFPGPHSRWQPASWPACRPAMRSGP